MKIWLLISIGALTALLAVIVLSPFDAAQAKTMGTSISPSERVWESSRVKPALKPTLIPATPNALPAPEPEDVYLPDDEGLMEEPPPPTPEPTPEPVLLVLPNDDLVSHEHYIAQNDMRYRTYMAANAWCAARMAIALCNAGVDHGFYDQVRTIPDPASVLALCNKNHQLPREYVPDGLRAVDGTNEKLRADAADAFERMSAALRDELGLRLHIVSGYRGYQTQETVYANYARRDGTGVADTYSARAGFSEHQTGLAVDITHKAPSGGLRRLRFEDTPQFQWLTAHAHEYGFILRSPDGWMPVTGYLYEPWHWRYVGEDHAARYHAGGYTVLEEYLGEEALEG